MVIIWSNPAKEDLRQIHQYITQDSKQNADRVIQDIINQVENLSHFPRIGRMVPEIAEEDLREISLYSYRILYELSGDTVYIHSIIHKRQDFKAEDLFRK